MLMINHVIRYLCYKFAFNTTKHSMLIYEIIYGAISQVTLSIKPGVGGGDFNVMLNMLPVEIM